MEKEVKLFYSREEMYELNVAKLAERGVRVEDIAKVSYNQQTKYDKGVTMEACIESVNKILCFDI